MTSQIAAKIVSRGISSKINCFVFIRLCFDVIGILAVNGEDGVGNRAFQIAIVVFRPKEEPLMLQFSPRPITTLIGREDARKSGRCITRFAVGKLKMRVMPVTIRTRAGAGLNCNQFKFLFTGLCAPPHGLRPIK